MDFSCEFCKQKKSRCDSLRPQCSNCQRKGYVCEYREKGQPGLRPGYGKALEQRMSVLEDNLMRMNQTVQEVLEHSRAQSQIISGTNVQQQPLMETGNTSHTGPVQDQLPQPQAWQAAQNRIYASPHQPSLLEGSQSMSAWTGSVNGLPDQEILRQLVDLFFDLVHPWLPLFCKQHFLSNLFSPERDLLLHGIVVVAFRYWSQAMPSVEMRENYIRFSRDQILLRTIDQCTLISAQTLALLAVDALGEGPGPRTWNAMSMLVSASKHLGLSKNREAPSDNADLALVRNEDEEEGLNLTNVAAEERRRLFWVIFALDRLSSASHGQPAGIDTKGIKTLYPASDDDWGQSGSGDWFEVVSPTSAIPTHSSTNIWHSYIDLLVLMDKTNKLLIEPVNLAHPTQCQDWQNQFRRLDGTVSNWFQALPKAVRDVPLQFDSMWYTLHAAFYLVNIRMYTVAAFPATTSAYLKPSSSARGRCRQAVRSVATLASSVQQTDFQRLGPMFAFTVWVAARSLVILWTTGYENTYGAIPPDLDALLMTLRQMSVWWKCAQRYVDMIQLILNTRNDPGGPTGLQIFNDTRRTAYGLQQSLGSLTGHQAMNANPHSFDFLDMPILDTDGFSPSMLMGFGAGVDGEWL